MRHYESVLRVLAARGHEVDLTTERAGKASWPAAVTTLAQECPAIRLSLTPTLADDPWWELATRLRQARFYLRSLEPAYRGTPGLPTRARDRASRLAIRLAESFGLGRLGRRLLVRVIDVLEQSTRSASAFHGYLRDRRPDLLVTTPLVILKTTQLDEARAALELRPSIGLAWIGSISRIPEKTQPGSASMTPGSMPRYPRPPRSAACRWPICRCRKQRSCSGIAVE